jgi:hypothetical protein
MKSAITAFWAGALLSLAAMPSLGQSSADWVDIKSATELQALYSNKTFKGKDWMDRPWVGHYRSDGQGILLFEGGRYPRTWQVTGNDQVCVKALTGPACYRFQRHRTKPGVFRNINVANDNMVEFTVEDGVPQF